MLKVYKAAAVIGGTSLGLGALLLWLYWEEMRAGGGDGSTLFGKPGDREAPDDQGDQDPETPGTSDPDKELGPAVDQGEDIDGGGGSPLLEVTGPTYRETTPEEQAQYDSRWSRSVTTDTDTRVLITLEVSELEQGFLPPPKVRDAILRDYRDIFGDVPPPEVVVLPVLDGYAVTLVWSPGLSPLPRPQQIREAMQATNPTLAARVGNVVVE